MFCFCFFTHPALYGDLQGATPLRRRVPTRGFGTRRPAAAPLVTEEKEQSQQSRQHHVWKLAATVCTVER